MRAKSRLSGSHVLPLVGTLLVGCSSALTRESAGPVDDQRVLIGQPCPDAWEEGTLEVVPRASSRDPDVLEIEVTFRSSEPARPPITATILARDEQPALVELAPALTPGWSLVVTPYRLGNDGLRHLWQCKERLRGSAARGRSG